MAEEKKTTMKKKVEANETAEKTYTKAEVEEMIAAAIAKLQSKEPTSKKEDEWVTLVYMGVAAENSTVLLGTEQNRGLGEISARGGIKTVRKSDFEEKMNPQISKRLKDRRLIVVSGLTDDERELYGVKYTDGELLSKDIYKRLFTMTDEKIAEIFKKACPRHKEIIATMFIDAYVSGNNRINQPIVEKLNEISKEVDAEGMFTPILRDMYRVLSDNASKK